MRRSLRTSRPARAGRPYRSALVTGASGGIGECFAERLAAAGTDLVLVARRAALLEESSARLRDRYRVQAEVLTADLADPAAVAQVEQRLADPDRPVDLLVNNAGGGSRPPLPFADQGLDRTLGTISLNVAAPVRLTRAALPGMLGRGHGGVLNVSSVMGFWPQPRGVTYGATKAFLTAFSESLHCEAAPHGVHVTAVCPGFTRRGPRGERGGPRSFRLPEFAWLERDDVARAALAAVAAGEPVCVPGAPYRAAVLAARLLPRPAVRGIFRRLWG
jgi:hypothetical protein